MSESKPANGLKAKVKSTVVVGEGGDLSVELIIDVENKTGKDLPLDQDYAMHVGQPRNPAVTVGKESIETGYSGGDLMVYFSRRKPDQFQIPKDGRFSFTVRFSQDGGDPIGKKVLIVTYPINPGTHYGNIPITSHSFEQRFVFKKPKPWYWWALKTNQIEQKADNNLKATREHRWTTWFSATQHAFPLFEVERGQHQNITLVRTYAFSSKTTAVFGAIVSPIGLRIIKALLE